MYIQKEKGWLLETSFDGLVSGRKANIFLGENKHSKKNDKLD